MQGIYIFGRKKCVTRKIFCIEKFTLRRSEDGEIRKFKK